MTRKSAAELQEGDRFTLGDRVVEVQAGATHCIYLLPFDPKQANEYVMRSTLDFLFPNGIPVTPKPEPSPLPCPFCGSTNTRAVGSRQDRYIQCKQCEADGPLKPTNAEALTAWNEAKR